MQVLARELEVMRELVRAKDEMILLLRGYRDNQNQSLLALGIIMPTRLSSLLLVKDALLAAKYDIIAAKE